MANVSLCRDCAKPAPQQVHGFCRTCFNKTADAFFWAEACYREEARANDANGRTVAFFTACTQERDTITRLDWLAGLVDMVEEFGLPAELDDIEAGWTAVRESRALLADLRAAVAQARGQEGGYAFWRLMQAAQTALEVGLPPQAAYDLQMALERARKAVAP